MSKKNRYLWLFGLFFSFNAVVSAAGLSSRLGLIIQRIYADRDAFQSGRYYDSSPLHRKFVYPKKYRYFKCLDRIISLVFIQGNVLDSCLYAKRRTRGDFTCATPRMIRCLDMIKYNFTERCMAIATQIKDLRILILESLIPRKDQASLLSIINQLVNDEFVIINDSNNIHSIEEQLFISALQKLSVINRILISIE